MTSAYKLAFVVRNEFMFLQIEKLWRSYPESEILLMGSSTNWDELLSRQNESDMYRFKQVTYRDATKLDGVFDGIFFQTPFPFIEEFSRSRLISVQYGLAKERHNYGAWRSLADLNLMYGSYSTRIVSHFSPSVAVGNLKFAGMNMLLAPNEKADLARRLGLITTKPTLLYMPTYHDLGSFERLVEPLSRLMPRYNVVIKMHHKEEARGNTDWRHRARSLGFSHLFGAGADQGSLLAVSDIVISDFSGAIFDGLYAQKPLVLYQEGAEALVGTQKFDLDSIEYRRRHELGVVCDDPEALAGAVGAAMQFSNLRRVSLKSIRNDLMVDGVEVDILQAAHNAVDGLLQGTLEPMSSSQNYVRDTYRSLLATERKLLTAQKRLAKPLWKRLISR